MQQLNMRIVASTCGSNSVLPWYFLLVTATWNIEINEHLLDCSLNLIYMIVWAQVLSR